MKILYSLLLVFGSCFVMNSAPAITLPAATKAELCCLEQHSLKRLANVLVQHPELMDALRELAPQEAAHLLAPSSAHLSRLLTIAGVSLGALFLLIRFFQSGTPDAHCNVIDPQAFLLPDQTPPTHCWAFWG